MPGMIIKILTDSPADYQGRAHQKRFLYCAEIYRERKQARKKGCGYNKVCNGLSKVGLALINSKHEF
jgi:ribosomal protein L20